jgi:hypothetical protein
MIRTLGHQQLEDGAAMQSGIDVAGPQVGTEQVLAAEDVERQEAVVVVVSVEEPVFLVAVDQVVGGVEVEDEFLGCSSVGLDELLDEHLGHGHE